jgi:hypothetical protein
MPLSTRASTPPAAHSRSHRRSEQNAHSLQQAAEDIHALRDRDDGQNGRNVAIVECKCALTKHTHAVGERNQARHERNSGSQERNDRFRERNNGLREHNVALAIRNFVFHERNVAFPRA